MPVNRRGGWPIAAAIALASVFALVVILSVIRRSEDYSAYPQYSSLNNEAAGTKAYFNSLERLGYEAGRNYRAISELNGTTDTVFFAGASSVYFRALPAKDLGEMIGLAKSGARLVIALDPKQVEWPNVPQPPTGKQIRKDDKTAASTLQEEWDIKLGRTDANDKRFTKESGKGSYHGPAKFYIWYFASWASEWKASGKFGDTPLFLERKFGTGSIVLMANADLLTNEQLLAAPDADALTAAAGRRGRVIFDENHLGVADRGSVAGLASAHHLQWALFCFGMLAVFYIWRNSVSFVPPAAIERDTTVVGHDSYKALQALLRRSIPENELLGTAAAEWNRNWKLERRPGSRPLDEGELFQARSARKDQAVRLYGELSKRLNRKSEGRHETTIP
jgi:hypothetical protein